MFVVNDSIIRLNWPIDKGVYYVVRYFAYAVIVFLIFTVLVANAGDKERLAEYYYSAKNVITDLNAVAADIEDAKPSKGLSPVSAKPLKKKLAKVREGLESILASSENAKEINEGYILYIDKMTLALSISENYSESKDKATRTKLINALEDAEEQKIAIDAKWKSSLKDYGLQS